MLELRIRSAAVWTLASAVAWQASGWGFSGVVAVQAEDTRAVELRLQSAVQFLADDAREGRGTGTKGLEQAADYIAAEFTQLGLKTQLVDGSPYQRLEVVTEAKLGPAEKNRLVLIGPAGADGHVYRRC